MPAKLFWTAARDAQIRRLRAEGATWDAIAEALLLSRFTVIERGRRIGARKPAALPKTAPEDPCREALPAGHPRTWGALIAGTVLEGEAYPLPYFR